MRRLTFSHIDGIFEVLVTFAELHQLSCQLPQGSTSPRVTQTFSPGSEQSHLSGQSFAPSKAQC